MNRQCCIVLMLASLAMLGCKPNVEPAGGISVTNLLPDIEPDGPMDVAKWLAEHALRKAPGRGQKQKPEFDIEHLFAGSKNSRIFTLAAVASSLGYALRT